MIVLALSTATPLCGVAVHDSDTGAAQVLREQVTTHSERLLPLIDEALRRAGTRKSALGAVVCAGGPGSFTGLRIGLSTAKGLCFALGLPLVLVPTLEALALPARAGHPGAKVLACLHARRGEVYARLFVDSAQRSGARCIDSAQRSGAPFVDSAQRSGAPCIDDAPVVPVPAELRTDSAWAPAALLAALSAALGPELDGLVVCGDGPRHNPELAPAGVTWTEESGPDPLWLGRRGIELLRAGVAADLNTAAPNYVCPSAPERLQAARAAAQESRG